MTEHPDPAPKSPAPAADALDAMAPMVQGAIVALGLFEAVIELRAVDLRADATPALIAIAHLGAIVLAAWVARRLLNAGAALLGLIALQAGATARLAETADRLAMPREWVPPPVPASPTSPAAPVTAVADNSGARALSEIRVAIRQSEWARAEALIQTFAGTHADDRTSAVLHDELADARRSAAAALRTRLDAAREANDTDRVFELHQALAPLLGPEELRGLDRELARGFMGQLQKRLRNGTISIDVAVLASRVAEAFDATPEGASLRAALPTLRRSVGLCPRCGKPYAGIADACPACLASASFPVHTVPAGHSEDHGDDAGLPGSVEVGEIDLEPD